MNNAYHYPRSKEEYFENVSNYWELLYDILERFLPPNEVQQAAVAKEFQDPNISKFFQDAWFLAPDHRSIHDIPGWDILCDLCSESYLLHEENDQE